MLWKVAEIDSTFSCIKDGERSISGPIPTLKAVEIAAAHNATHSVEVMAERRANEARAVLGRDRIEEVLSTLDKCAVDRAQLTRLRRICAEINKGLEQAIESSKFNVNISGLNQEMFKRLDDKLTKLEINHRLIGVVLSVYT